MLKLGVAALRRASGSLPCLEGLVSIEGNEVLRGVLKKLFGKWRLADTRTGKSHVDIMRLSAICEWHTATSLSSILVACS